MSSPTFVYDTGMLIDLERQDRTAQILHRLVIELIHPPVVPLPVLAQAWRPGRWTPLTRVVPECVVFGARVEEPPPCGVCHAGHVVQDAKRAGQLLAVATIPEQKGPDAVDALAVVVAARHPEAIIVTSDPDDVVAYRDALSDAEAAVRILPETEIANFLAGRQVLL